MDGRAAGRIDSVKEIAANDDVADTIPFAPQVVCIARLNLYRPHLLMAKDVVLHRHVAGEDEERTRAVVVEVAVADNDVVRVIRPVEEDESVLRLFWNVLGEGDVKAVIPIWNALRLQERAEESRRGVVTIAELHPVALPRS